MFLVGNYKQTQLIILFVAGLVFLSGCAEPLPGPGAIAAKFSQDKYDSANELRGGRLYDKWWDVTIGGNKPTIPNPVWSEVIALDPSNPNGNENQWRCKECHGWDYKGVRGVYGDKENTHYTGIRGLDNGNPEFIPEQIFRMISVGEVDWGGGTKISHSYAKPGFLTTTDIYDLTRFIYEVARPDSISTTLGDVGRGEIVFNNIPNARDPSWDCNTAGCHKANSSSAPPLAAIIEISIDTPEEFLHKVRFGAPGSQMPEGMTPLNAQDLRAFVAAGANSVAAPTSDFDQTKYDALGRTHVAAGARLYDAWWEVSLGATKPGTTHSRWPASNTLLSGSETWRCKACHGWDYRGSDGNYSQGKNKTGYQGIVSTSNKTMQFTTASDVYSFIKEDANHGFDNLLTGDDYYALTKFIITMRGEMSASQSAVNFINYTTYLTKNGADAVNGKTLYEEKGTTTCGNAGCHGADGKQKDFADNDPTNNPNQFIHNIAQENPWRFMHKIRFGQPIYGPMPTLYDASDATITTINAAADILAYAQINLVPNIKRAGLLYDQWWKVEGIVNSTEPTTRNKTWVANLGNTDATVISDATTWRCKECHGWDYQGVHGAYAEGSKHYSGIRGFFPVLNTVNRDKDFLIDVIKSGGGSSQLEDHDFGRFLDDTDIALLADFILDETAGVPKLVSTYDGFIADGNAEIGKEIYQGGTPGKCESCHGASGTTISTVDIAAIANENPPAFLHKVRYGQPGSIMLPSSLGFLGLGLTEASHVLAYAKTLSSITDPTPDPDPMPDPDPGTYSYATADVVRGGRLYDKWWQEMQATDDTVMAPADYNPLWAGRSINLPDFPTSYSETKKIETTWRCKSCHDWDYKGTGYYTGIGAADGADNLLYKTKIRREDTYTGDEIALQQHMYDWISGAKSSQHSFGVATTALPTPLSPRDLWDLTRFLLEDGLINTDTNILGSGDVIAVSGDNGDGLYNGSVDSTVNCVVCHGAEGNLPPPVDQGGSGDPLDIFQIGSATDNPWEFLHKVRFGQPGTSMPAIEGTNTLGTQDAFDILGFAQQKFKNR